MTAAKRLRLAFTSDLHVEYHLEVVGCVAERVAELDPDVLVLAGDVCPDLPRLERALRIIGQSLRGPLLYLPGNHELWCGGAGGTGPDSRTRYEQVLPELARRAGAVPLGRDPVQVHGISFVGVTGWYDDSLRDPELDAALGPVDYAGEPRQEVTCVDALQVHWPDDRGEPLSNERLSEHMVALLRRQLSTVGPGPVVAVTHMLPHRSLLSPPGVGRSANPAERCRDAFMGSRTLGDALAEHPGVVFAIAGHHHQAVALDLPISEPPLPCAVSPIGYPRELDSSLEAHVAARVSVREITLDSTIED